MSDSATNNTTPPAATKENEFAEKALAKIAEDEKIIEVTGDYDGSIKQGFKDEMTFKLRTNTVAEFSIEVLIFDIILILIAAWVAAWLANKMKSAKTTERGGSNDLN